MDNGNVDQPPGEDFPGPANLPRRREAPKVISYINYCTGKVADTTDASKLPQAFTSSQAIAVITKNFAGFIKNSKPLRRSPSSSAVAAKALEQLPLRRVRRAGAIT